MNGLQAGLAILGTLVVLGGVGAGVWAFFTSAGRDAAMNRLRVENEDVIRRLNYVEPRLKDSEAKNALLMELHNPTARLDAISALQVQDGKDNRNLHERTVTLLNAQHTALLEAIEEISEGREQ